MSKVIIDLNEFVPLKEDSVYNYHFSTHKQYDYTILQTCNEESNTLNFYKKSFDGIGNVFLFSCEYLEDGSKVYEGDLGFVWS